MSDNYSYELPEEEAFLSALLKILQSKAEVELYSLLQGATCEISSSGSYSRKRWNALYTTVFFHIPIENYRDLDETTKAKLIYYCDIVMPKSAGLDVRNVELSPSLNPRPSDKTLKGDLEDINRSLQKDEVEFQLPPDLTKKGKEMAEAYLYLYAVENYLRVFIQTLAEERFGQGYFGKLTIPASLRRSIDSRKEQEQRNQWLRMRGDSDLFYLDFNDLGVLILNNWELFKSRFPDQAWISSKINELYGCRNLVAHNSYIGEHERDVIRVGFRSIVRQINLKP